VDRVGKIKSGEEIRETATRLFHASGIVWDLLETLQLNPVTKETLNFYLSQDGK
jgi:hypothetical protein